MKSRVHLLSAADRRAMVRRRRLERERREANALEFGTRHFALRAKDPELARVVLAASAPLPIDGAPARPWNAGDPPPNWPPEWPWAGDVDPGGQVDHDRVLPQQVPRDDQHPDGLESPVERGARVERERGAAEGHDTAGRSGANGLWRHEPPRPGARSGDVAAAATTEPDEGWSKPWAPSDERVSWPSAKRPTETQKEYEKRLERERAQRAHQLYDVSEDGARPLSRAAAEAVERSLRADATRREYVPYRGRPGRGVVVDLRRGTVTDRRNGRPIPGVAIGPDGSLVAAAPPPALRKLVAFALAPLGKMPGPPARKPAAPPELVETRADDERERFAFLREAFETMKALATRPVHVHAELPPVRVDVHVPEQPAPHVEVTVEQPAPRSVRVEYDRDGNKRFVVEDGA